MPLHTIEPKRLYRQIADQLRTLIEGGEFGPLHTPAGRARPGVAARRLAPLGARGADRARGRRPGRGAHGLGHLRARASAGNGAPGRVTAEAPLETIRAREVIESELAARAAATMKPRQLRGLARRHRARWSRTRPAGTLPTRGDRQFHVLHRRMPPTTPSCCVW
jgi:GntR family transcriptional repressor for pyruvate dehydrogenase complex